jgi:hypothetical protein
MKREFVQIRISAAEKQRLVRRATAAGMDLSGFLLAPHQRDLSARFLSVVAELPGAPQAQLQFAELNDLLTSASGAELRVLPSPRFATGDELSANLIAAMVELACCRCGCPPPAWTQLIPPMSVPYFASSLRSLRPHLLRASPAPFRARNLFVDTTLGGRV